MYFWNWVVNHPLIVPATNRGYIGGHPLPGVASFAYYQAGTQFEYHKSINTFVI